MVMYPWWVGCFAASALETNEYGKRRIRKEETVTEIYNGWVIADFRDLHQLAASTALEQLLGSLAPAMPPILVCYL